MFAAWVTDSKQVHLLVEFCCAEDSNLSTQWMKQGPTFAAWRVTSGAELVETVLKLQDALTAFCKKKDVTIWFHCSLPCSGGSPLLRNREFEDGRRQRLALLRSVFKRLLIQADKVFTHVRSICSRCNFSFELSKSCAY